MKTIPQLISLSAARSAALDASLAGTQSGAQSGAESGAQSGAVAGIQSTATASSVATSSAAAIVRSVADLSKDDIMNGQIKLNGEVLKVNEQLRQECNKVWSAAEKACKEKEVLRMKLEKATEQLMYLKKKMNPSKEKECKNGEDEEDETVDENQSPNHQTPPPKQN